MLIVFMAGLASPAGGEPVFTRGELRLVGLGPAGDGAATLAVEFAINPAQHSFGLMMRSHLPENNGMLFIFDGEKPRSFWMKNTRIPLDMVFFDGAGHFVSMISDVPPLTLSPRLSEGPAQYVLEVNAGKARRLGVGRLTRLDLAALGSAEIISD